MKFWILLLTFVLGLGFGLGLPFVAPKYLDKYGPNFMRGPTQQVKGAVVRKQSDPTRLLLTLSLKEGAMLATFEKTIAEISLLVEEGDIVTLAVRNYSPFVTDPPILRVNKPENGSSMPPAQREATPLESEPAGGS